MVHLASVNKFLETVLVYNLFACVIFYRILPQQIGAACPVAGVASPEFDGPSPSMLRSCSPDGQHWPGGGFYSCPSAFHTQFSAELPLFLSFSVSGGMLNKKYGITGPHIVQEMEISQPFWLDHTMNFW